MRLVDTIETKSNEAPCAKIIFANDVVALMEAEGHDFLMVYSAETGKVHDRTNFHKNADWTNDWQRIHFWALEQANPSYSH